MSIGGSTSTSLLIKDESLEELMERHLGRHLDRGDTIRIEGFELVVEKSSLIAGSTILIRSMA